MLYSQWWLLFPHIAAGVAALVIGPLQFSRRLRQGNLARHRLLGKTYVVAVVVASVLAPVMAWHYPAFFPYRCVTQSCAWLITTGAALLTARNRHIEQHRRWMARSYAVGSVFVLVRVLNPVPAFRPIEPRGEQLFDSCLPDIRDHGGGRHRRLAGGHHAACIDKFV